MRNNRALVVFTCAALNLIGTPAYAFVCSRVQGSNQQDTGPSLSWFTRHLAFTQQASGTTDIPGTAERIVLRNSFNVWKNVTLGSDARTACGNALGTTDLTFSEQTPSTSTFVGYNYLEPEKNENLLIFQENAWPHPDGVDSVIALTTATFSVPTGEILDADIEFNSATFQFVAGNPNNTQMDLANTAVHEIGHFLGLAHSPVITATMYFRAPPGETSKADLDCDDAHAVTFKYPNGAANGYCSSTPTTACGFCASFSPSTVSPNFSQTGSDNGLGSSGGCRQAPATVELLMLASVVALYLRRRCNMVFSNGRTSK